MVCHTGLSFPYKFKSMAQQERRQTDNRSIEEIEIDRNGGCNI